MIWPQGRSRPAELDPSRSATDIEAVPDRIRALKPRDEVQESLKGRAAELSESLLQTRWLSASEVEPSVQITFVVILLFWLTITFSIFGLLAPGNATVRTVFFVCAISVGSAMFLVLELDGPFHGLDQGLGGSDALRAGASQPVGGSRAHPSSPGGSA